MKLDDYICIKNNNYKEICKFTADGFFYNDQKIEDNGEVHRLLKQVLNGLVEDQIKDIKLSERELCAKIAENFHESVSLHPESTAAKMFKEIAKAIREER